MSGDVDSLAARARAGERAAFVALVERFQAPLLHFLSLRTATREDAEELTQETFLRAWRFLDRYDPRRPFATWLYTLGARLTISEHRRRRERTVERETLERAAESVPPSTALSEREQRENLWNLARRLLSEEQHAALWLRYGEDLDSHEIARVLGKREPTVRVILFRARERLAEGLTRAPEFRRPAVSPGCGGATGRSSAQPYPLGERVGGSLEPGTSP